MSKGIDSLIPQSRIEVTLLLQATAFEYQPVTTITKRPDGTEEWGGYEYKLFEAAAKHLKFDFDIGPPLVCCVWGKGCGKFMTITEILSTIETAYKVTGYSYKV